MLRLRYFLFIFCLTVPLAVSEIHRARSVQTFKHRNRADRRNPEESRASLSEAFIPEECDGGDSCAEPKWMNEIVWGHQRQTWLYSAISAGLVGLSGIFPLLVIPIEAGEALRSGSANGRLKLLLSFAVGGLLGDVFLHLLPEAWAHLRNFKSEHEGHMQIGQWLLAGLLSFLIIEKIFPESDDEESCEEETSDCASLDGSITDAGSSEISSTEINEKKLEGKKKKKKKRRKELKEDTTTSNGHCNGTISSAVANGHCNGKTSPVANGYCNGKTSPVANGYCNGKTSPVANGYCNGKTSPVANGYCNGKTSLVPNGHCNGKTSPVANGYCNGKTSPVANGYCNGKTSPVANGYCNGKTSPVANGYCNGKTSPVANGYCNGKTSPVANGYCNGKTSPVANGYCNGKTSLVPNGHCNGETFPVASDRKTVVGETERKKEVHIKTSGWLNLMANVIDNFTHGLAVAGSYCISPKMGMLTTFAILLHEIPHEIGDFAILLRAGFDRWKAAKAQFCTAFGGIIGAMLALSAESVKSAGDTTAWILPFTAGGFIYIALVTVIPDLLKEENPWNSLKQILLICTGISVMGLVTIMVD